MSTKFMKKGHLVVDVDNAKLHKVGDENPKTKKFLKSAGIEEAPEEKPAKATKTKEAAKPAKAEKPAKATKVEKETKKEPKAKKESAPKASRSALADRKIKVVTKKHTAKEGTKRHAWFEALISSKTVGEAQEKVDGLDASVVRYAEKVGLITLA